MRQRRRALDARRRRRARHGGGRHRRARFRSTISPLSASAPFRARLPMILRRIRETADAIIAARPDALVIIDSPDFTHRVARRVRAPRAVDPDHRLCLAVGMGVAAGARARHARLCRLRARDPAVRAGRASAARRSALHLCRPSADRAACRAAPERRTRRAPAEPIRRLFWCCRAAARARSAGCLAIFGDAIARVAPARRTDGAGAADGAASCSATCAPASPAGR